MKASTLNSGTAVTPIMFTVPAVPVGQPRQRHRMVTPKGKKPYASNYTPTDHPVNAFKASVRMAAREAYGGPPLKGPVFLGLVFVMPRPTAKIWKRKPMPREWDTRTPDFDNVTKALMDALKGLLWRDDRQVCSAMIEKVVASGPEQPHADVYVSEAVSGTESQP